MNLKSLNQLKVTPDHVLNQNVHTIIATSWNAMAVGRVRSPVTLTRHLESLQMPYSAYQVAKARPEYQALHWLLDR